MMDESFVEALTQSESCSVFNHIFVPAGLVCKRSSAWPKMLTVSSTSGWWKH